MLITTSAFEPSVIWHFCHPTHPGGNSRNSGISVSLSVSAQRARLGLNPDPQRYTYCQQPPQNLCNKTVNCAAFTAVWPCALVYVRLCVCPCVCVFRVRVSFSQLATVTHERAGSRQVNRSLTLHCCRTSYLCNVARVPKVTRAEAEASHSCE